MLSILKTGIWLYFFIWIFEGALRKWILPQLATPLLVVRDPLAIALLIFAWRKGVFRLNWMIIAVWIFGLFSFFTAILLGHGNWYVALFGLRILLIHFPLIFVIGSVFGQKDVENVGRTLLYISIPMIALVILQFYSPQSAWVNRGVGGDLEGAGFGGAMGYFRPPGTFSFTNGNVMFWSLTNLFVFYFWLVPGKVHKVLLVLATVAMLFSIPLSISRTLLFLFVLTLLFTLFIIIRNPKYTKALVWSFIGLGFLAIILAKVSIAQTSVEVFLARFTNANESEGGLEGVFIDRFLGGMMGAISNSNALPFFGYGLGMGTNVGSVLLSGEMTFLIAEEEWARIIGEMGILFGLGLIVIRLTLVYQLGVRSFQRLGEGNILPWLLFSVGGVTLLQGQWAQPTALGFSTLLGGLILASLNRRLLSR